jgi:hypothetical protein
MPNDKLPESAKAALPTDREPKMYVHKQGEPFKAVQWTGSNMDAVREVYPGLGEEYMRDKGCGIGFWVVSPYPGRVYFLTDEDFRSNYEQASRLSQAQPKIPAPANSLAYEYAEGYVDGLTAQPLAEQVKKVCVVCLDFEENIRYWIEQLGGDPEVTHLSFELEKLIEATALAKAEAPPVRSYEDGVRDAAKVAVDQNISSDDSAEWQAFTNGVSACVTAILALLDAPPVSSPIKEGE